MSTNFSKEHIASDLRVELVSQTRNQKQQGRILLPPVFDDISYVLLISPEDGRDIFLRKFYYLSANCMILYPRR
jgi:hypothetical protein